MAAPSPFRPLASQLLTRIVWLAMGCALIVALLQSWQVYETEQNRFRALLDDMGQTHVPILTLLLWDIETDALQRHLEQLAKRPEIASVTLRSATGMQFQAGAPTPAPPSDARLTIPHPGGHAEPLGELFIQYERNVLYRTLLHAVSRTVIELAVFTTLICLVVIRVLHTQLNVYLRRITHYVNGLDPRTPPLPLDLRRPKRPWCDEIDLIAEGFARLGLSMAHYEAQRNQAISDLAAQRDALDTRVEERTAELQRMTEHLEILSRSDPLTNLANRRHFDEVKRLEARRMQRSGQPMSLLMMDVDFFKRYNDHFGHAQGDRCLVSIARTLSRTFQRAGELAVRMGGEEFAVLLPGYAPDQARDAAERLRAAVEGLNLPHPESPIGKVTVSVGCATQLMPPPWDGDDQTVDTRIEVWMDRLMRQADDTLYRAKSAGRNQIACTTATPVSASPGAAHNDPAHGA